MKKHPIPKQVESSALSLQPELISPYRADGFNLTKGLSNFDKLIRALPNQVASQTIR